MSDKRKETPEWINQAALEVIRDTNDFCSFCEIVEIIERHWRLAEEP